MEHCLLLFLSADHLHAQHMAGGKIVTQLDFPDSPDGRANFSAFLQTAKYPTYLLADLIEEDFRHETVLHLSGGSRTALLQRKLDQFYCDTPYHLATLLQRQSTGRRDDDMLFSALTNPALIAPWLEIMLAQQTLLAGIYSVPQISAPLVENHPSNHLLLISWEKFAGLRQTYFSDHRLQISRLTPIHAGLTFHAAVANELAHTYQYLKSLSLLPSGQTLDVRILCHAEDRARLEASNLPDGADMHYDFADLNEVARQLKVDYSFTDSDASQIFLHLLAAKPPKANYANAGHRHYHQLWQLRRALNWSCVALLLCSLSWATADILQNSGHTEKVASLNDQTQQIFGETQQITRTLPNTRTPASDMKTGVSVMRKLDQYAPVPSEILRPISAMLDRYPQIELDEFSWQTNATESVPANTPAGVPAQIISLKGHLTGFANDYRAALNYLERFQRDLAAQGYQVTALSKPLDLSPGGSIADQREARANAFDFSLKLFRRLTV